MTPSRELAVIAAVALVAGGVLRADVQSFQPNRVFFDSVTDQVYSLNVSLLPIALGQIDQTRTLGAEHVQAQA